MWPALIMALAGAAKSEFVDRPKADKQRDLAATTHKYSQWTRLRPEPIQEADPFDSAMSWGATGAAMNSGMKQDAYMDARTKRLNDGGSLLGYGKATDGRFNESGEKALEWGDQVDPGAVDSGVVNQAPLLWGSHSSRLKNPNDQLAYNGWRRNQGWS